MLTLLSVALAAALPLASPESSERHTVLHAQSGRLLALPPSLDTSRKVKICVLAPPPPPPGVSPTPTPTPAPTPDSWDPARQLEIAGKSPFRVELVAPAGSCFGACIQAAEPEAERNGACAALQVDPRMLSDGVLRYRLRQPRSLPEKDGAESSAAATAGDNRRQAIIDTLTRQTKDLLPKGGYVLSGLAMDSSSEKLVDVQKALKALSESLSKSQETVQQSAALAGTLSDLEVWIGEVTRHETMEKKKEAERTAVRNGGGTLFFEGELVFGGYRRAMLLNHDGSAPMGVTTDFEPVAPHEHLLFYLQRPGTDRFQAKLESGDKKPFELISPALPNSSVPARWTVERIGDATNFKTGRDIALTVTKLGEKTEVVRQIAIPVIESYRWLVTTGVYFSGMPRRTFYLSDVANRTSGTTQSSSNGRVETFPGGPMPTATPSDITTVTTRTETTSSLKSVVALSEQGKPNPAGGIFMSFYLKTRINRPGRIFRAENLIPAIVLGAKLDAPLQEGMLGLGVEPIRGIQIIGGLVKGRRTELGEGAELGKPLLVSTTIPTIHRVGNATGFVALAIDVKPIASELEKLLGKLF